MSDIQTVFKSSDFIKAVYMVAWDVEKRSWEVGIAGKKIKDFLKVT